MRPSACSNRTSASSTSTVADKTLVTKSTKPQNILARPLFFFLPSVVELRLCEEVFDQFTIVFIFDSGEEPGGEFSDRLRFVEWKAVVNLSTTEMTRHAFRLEDRF